MRMNPLAALLTLISFSSQLILPMSAWAGEGNSLFSNYSSLKPEEKESVDQLVEICSDKSKTQVIQKPNGFASVVFYSRKEGEKGEPRVIDCAWLGSAPTRSSPLTFKKPNPAPSSILKNPSRPRKRYSKSCTTMRKCNAVKRPEPKFSLVPAQRSSAVTFLGR